jgi:hypothetical protein
MSTKIFNGYRIRCSSFKQLQAFLDAFRVKAEEYFEYQYATCLATEAANIIDSEVLGIKLEEKSRNRSLYWDLYDLISAKYKKVKQTYDRDPRYDFECELSIHAAGGKYVYILIYAQQHGYEAILKQMPGIEYYGYWDNADPDSDVSENAFRARGKVWDRVLGKTSTPMHRGMTFTIVGSTLPMPKYERIIQHMIPFEDRVAKMARKLAMEIAPTIEKNEANMPDLSKWIDFLNSEEYKKQIEVEKVRIAPLLKKILTVEDLKNHNA